MNHNSAWLHLGILYTRYDVRNLLYMSRPPMTLSERQRVQKSIVEVQEAVEVFERYSPYIMMKMSILVGKSMPLSMPLKCSHLVGQ